MNSIKESNIGNLLNQLEFDDSEELVNELNNEIFENELYIILTDNGELMVLISQENEGDFFVPVFSDYKSLCAGMDSIGDDSLDADIATGRDIMSIYFDDCDFSGLIVNPSDDHYVFECGDLEAIN
ncbi:MAG: hypothetical protein Q4P18_08060 [Methanobrevibacter sp.]|uniref:SseB family protein n=1 Tax=Methanobrevibacter sp. TaxID=66852 RepID=UPI0026E073B7|nr:SseB family protein [Methanobrevibacter sp.]MDO5849475.1 hypothetical protein [Methanobrevibacter sp.]